MWQVPLLLHAAVVTHGLHLLRQLAAHHAELTTLVDPATAAVMAMGAVMDGAAGVDAATAAVAQACALIQPSSIAFYMPSFTEETHSTSS